MKWILISIPLILLLASIYFIKQWNKKRIAKKYVDLELERLNKLEKVTISVETFKKTEVEIDKDIIYSINQSLKHKKGENEYEFIQRLNAPYRYIFASSIVDEYIESGGFQMLYDYLGINIIDEAIHACELIKSHDHIEILLTGKELLIKYSKSDDLKKEMIIKELQILDKKYYKLPNIKKYRIEYYLKNKEIFIIKNNGS